MREIVTRALAWAFAGALIGPALVYCLMLVVLYRDPRCAPESGGSCQLDIGINLVLGLVFGAALFFLVTFIRGFLAKK